MQYNHTLPFYIKRLSTVSLLVLNMFNYNKTFKKELVAYSNGQYGVSCIEHIYSEIENANHIEMIFKKYWNVFIALII